MASEICRLKSCASAYIDSAAMVFMKQVLEFDVHWGIRNITTQYALLPTLLYLNITMGNLKPRSLMKCFRLIEQSLAYKISL